MIKLPSVRARLALWHTGILAALLAASAVVAIAMFRRTAASRTDSELLDTSRAFTSEMLAERKELPSAREAAAEALREFRFNNVAVAVFDSARRMIGVKPLAEDLPKNEPPSPQFEPRLIPGRLGAAFGKFRTFITIPDEEGGFRIVAVPVTVGPEHVLVAVASSLHQDNELIENAGAAFALIAPLVLLIAGGAGWFLAGRSLSPVGAMSDRAARISASTTSERLPVMNPGDELGKLAIVLNDLLDRLAEALAQQRRFMTDASHELRTPVAVVRAVADVILSQDTRDDTEYRDALSTVQREAKRLSRIVDDLFLLSRSDIGERPIHRAALYLTEIIGDSARDFKALAVEKNIRIECDLPETGAPLEGDEELLDRVFGNLIDNAIKFGPKESRVLISLSETQDKYNVSVDDEGPGVPPELRDRIFDRFFRVQDDDSSLPGAGLGLSISKWAIEAHGGTISVTDGPGHGARFIVSLPKGSQD